MAVTARGAEGQRGRGDTQSDWQTEPRPAGCALRLRHNVNPSIQSHACICTHVIKGPRI